MLDLQRLLARLRAAPAHVRATSSREIRAALAQVVDLRSTRREHRAIVVRNSPKLHTIAFAEQLLTLAADVAGESPAESIELLDAFETLADLPAFDVDEHQQAAIAELSAVAMIRRAVCLVKLGRLDDAGIVLRICREMDFTLVETSGEYEEAKAWLAAVKLELPQALAALASARELYESIGDQHLVGRVLLAQAYAFGEARNYPASVACLLDACEKIEPSRDRRLALAVCLNLARALRDAGRSDEALETISLTRDFVRSTARSLDLLHLRWLEAGLLADHRSFDAAAATYLEAAGSFAELGMAIEVSSIALEAAEAFTRAGRGRELVPLLVLAEKVQRAHGFDEERLAAWLALRAQLAADVVSAAAIAAARRAAALPH